MNLMQVMLPKGQQEKTNDDKEAISAHTYIPITRAPITHPTSFSLRHPVSSLWHHGARLSPSPVNVCHIKSTAI